MTTESEQENARQKRCRQFVLGAAVNLASFAPMEDWSRWVALFLELLEERSGGWQGDFEEDVLRAVRDAIDERLEGGTSCG